MPAFIKFNGGNGIEGEATDSGHDKWVLIQDLQSNILRTIPSGAKDQQRTKGETQLHDVTLIRQLDKSSPKLAEACANGTFYNDVQVDFCTQVKGKQEPYLSVKLKNVIVTSYNLSANHTGNPLPSESVGLGYTDIEWTYVVIDPQNGGKTGTVVGKFNPGTGTSK